ncbi:MAG: WYL domain-containing protein [Bacteroidales bacterium]|nr:WYL domain-containing protein [Bacteroidales bacterium]
MDQPKIERLLRLMMMLTANKYTIEQLSNKLEMSPRTIYRYIDTFRNAGFLIKKNSDGRFRLDRESKYFKEISELVHFTEEEAYILKNAIESIDENNILKQNLKSKLYSVYNYKIIADCVVKGSNAKNVNSLVDAIELRQQVILKDYTSANSKTTTDRLVEPIGFTTNYIQLWAYEISSGETKTFKVSRIGGVEILEKVWEYESQHKKGYIDIFRMHGFNKFNVKLKLGVKAASLLKEEFPLAEKHLVEHTDNNDSRYYILDLDVCSYEGVGRFVLGLLDDIEVIGSEEFKIFLKQRISKAKF